MTHNAKSGMSNNYCALYTELSKEKQQKSQFIGNA